MTLEITTVLASEADVVRILPMMEDFNRFEKIPWTREAGEAPLRVLLGDRRLGVVGIFEHGAATLGYFIVAFGYDLECGRSLTRSSRRSSSSRSSAGRDAVCTALMAEVERTAREHGVHALHLAVRPENEPALRLYTSAGVRVAEAHLHDEGD